jgi:hypothetical protein
LKTQIEKVMKKFSFRVATSPETREFLGDSWEEGGVSAGIDSPVADALGNKIVWSKVDPVTSADAALIGLWFAGEEPISEVVGLVDQCCEEVGLDLLGALEVVRALGLTWTADNQAELNKLRHARTLPTPEQKILSQL